MSGERALCGRVGEQKNLSGATAELLRGAKGTKRRDPQVSHLASRIARRQSFRSRSHWETRVFTFPFTLVLTVQQRPAQISYLRLHSIATHIFGMNAATTSGKAVLLVYLAKTGRTVEDFLRIEGPCGMYQLMRRCRCIPWRPHKHGCADLTTP